MRVALVARFGKVGDRSRALQRAQRFQRDQLRIARPEPDGDERSGRHRPGLASALTAAAVMALPPMRPRTIRNGRPRGFAARRILRLGGADEADRNAEDGGWTWRAGVDHFEQAEQRRRRIADCHHRAFEPLGPQIKRRGRASGAKLLRQLRHTRVAQGADHFVGGRQPRAGHAMRHHLGIAQDRSPSARETRLAPQQQQGRCSRHRSYPCAPFDHAAGMEHAHRDLGFARREAREIGLGADDGERALVDRRAVAQICRGLRHGRPRRFAWRA